MGVGVEEDGCFHSSVVDLLWELQLSWVTHPSSDGSFLRTRFCHLLWWADLAPPASPEDMAGPSSRDQLSTSGCRGWG